MNTQYLSLMEKTLSAYTDEHILQYFNKVKSEGLTEHGFPRLTANIGILISYGRRLDLLPIFIEMMEFCCKSIPNKKAANDFSVREIVCCIMELEKNNAVKSECTEKWKGYLKTIDPQKTYTVYAKNPTDPVKNWALFSAVSEFFRQKLVHCDSSQFIDVQIESQLKWLDENGMYMDADGDVHHPMVYDLVARGLFSLLLHSGYKGRHYQTIDAVLKKAGLLSLKMQSVNGELAFGGRSNQCLHNEAWLSAIFEFEAQRYEKDGDDCFAKKFKARAKLALSNLESWLNKTPISHVKNRFPIDSFFGCENYAYFDKYMITASSFLYVASLFCNDNILPGEYNEKPSIWITSEHFHKTFVKTKEYFLEFDTNADICYDACGLGRVHKRGAESAICLSVPFPSSNNSNYNLGKNKEQTAFSICPAIKKQDCWFLGAEDRVKYSLSLAKTDENCARVGFVCNFESEVVEFDCMVNDECVMLQAKGHGDVGIALPVFDFDGETHSQISAQDNKVCVKYGDWVCEYSADVICSMNMEVANRNGIYKCYMATGNKNVIVKIRIYPQ
ncbi:MAG: hypothetical protein E7353_07270 [Clostridiales bacterium]|nr:hypothetical protein [Clostridiales bacterium]